MDIQYQPNFQGKYIVKGSVKTVDNFNLLLQKKMQSQNQNVRKCWALDGELLIPRFDSDQPYMEVLTATNEDADKLGTYSANRMIKMAENGLDAMVQKLRSVHLKYFKAKEKGPQALNEFLFDKFTEGREVVNNIFGAEASKSIKSIDAEEAIEALKNNKFDITNGKILK